MKKLLMLIGGLLITVVGVSCGGSAEQAASAKATEAAAAKEIAAAKATEAAALQVIAAASVTRAHTSTPTNTPIPRDTATPRPTLALTSTPTPESTPTPTPGVVAVVTMSDGSVFEVDHISVEESYHQTSGTYWIHDDYEVRYLPLWIRPAALQIPFDKLDRMVVNPENSVYLDAGTALGATVLLVDGQQLQGFIAEFDRRGESSAALALVGRTTVAGYSGDYESAIREIDNVTFARDQSGEVLATVAAADGTVIENVSKLRFRIDGGTTLDGAYTRRYVGLQVGATTLEITPTDIQIIQREGDRFVVVLKSGEKLEGSIPSDFFLAGRTSVYGVPASFWGSFTMIQSVTFD